MGREHADCLPFPAWQFNGFDDPAAKRNIEHLRRVLQAGKDIGMNVGLVQCPNQGFRGAPQSIRAAKYPDDLGRRGTMGVNCCPSKPEGRKYLMELYGRLFAEFKDIGLDFLVCWPYDEGGCGCKDCWPWGHKGYPRMSRRSGPIGPEDVSELEAGPVYVGLRHASGRRMGRAGRTSEKGQAWVDYIMADSHEDFPRYPLDKGVPGGLPLVNFPEISMWGRAPWGGYGATRCRALPAALEPDRRQARRRNALLRRHL